MLSGGRCGRQGTALAQQGGGARPVQMDGPLLRGGFQPLSPQARLCDFWAVSQETGADFAMGPGLLGGCRWESFAVELADLGKYRRMVVFRAGSAWFGLRNRPEVCSSQAEFAGSSGTGGRCKACWLHRRLSDWRSRSVAAKLWRADDEVDARQPYGRFLAMVSGGVLLTSIWVSILVTKVRRNGGLTETLKGRRCRPRVSATFPLTPVR